MVSAILLHGFPNYLLSEDLLLKSESAVCARLCGQKVSILSELRQHIPSTTPSLGAGDQSPSHCACTESTFSIEPSPEAPVVPYISTGISIGIYLESKTVHVLNDVSLILFCHLNINCKCTKIRYICISKCMYLNLQTPLTQATRITYMYQFTAHSQMFVNVLI